MKSAHPTNAGWRKLINEASGKGGINKCTAVQRRQGCENFALLEFSGEEGEVIKVRELGVITHYTISSG